MQHGGGFNGCTMLTMIGCPTTQRVEPISGVTGQEVGYSLDKINSS